MALVGILKQPAKKLVPQGYAKLSINYHTKEIEENQFLKKISNLFSNNKNKRSINKLDEDKEVYPLKDIAEYEKLDQNNALINLNEDPIKSENNSEQISLLDIDENEKDKNMDDVLEIPAFLRRQAN